MSKFMIFVEDRSACRGRVVKGPVGLALKVCVPSGSLLIVGVSTGSFFFMFLAVFGCRSFLNQNLVVNCFLKGW